MSRSTLYYLSGIRPTSKTSLRTGTGSKENNHHWSLDFSCLQWYSGCLPHPQHSRGANGVRKDSQETYLWFLAVLLTSSLQFIYSKQTKVLSLPTINWKSSTPNQQEITKEAAKVSISLEKKHSRSQSKEIAQETCSPVWWNSEKRVTISRQLFKRTQEHWYQQLFSKQQFLKLLKTAYGNDQNLRHHEGGREKKKILHIAFATDNWNRYQKSKNSR